MLPVAEMAASGQKDETAQRRARQRKNESEAPD
jgi:hypothetical protein